jgi:large conductance mechanosensitive channel
MGWVKEFKEFAMKGNVLDLAIGIIIGGAFGKIVSSLVADVIMPPIGFLVGGVKFTELKIKLNPGQLDPAGTLKMDPVTINYGNFLQVTFDFIIIAFAIFMLVKGINAMKKKEAAAPSEPPAQPVDVVLLTEIRDLLKQK